jgi:A/G-specific adenine glycosylase
MTKSNPFGPPDVDGHIAPKSAAHIQRKLLKWGRANTFSYPWRETKNPWHALTAEVMLQRTRAAQVLPIYLDLTTRYGNPEGWLADPHPLAFTGLGLPIRHEQYRALNQKLAGQRFPVTRDALLSLPGVGDYIASAMLSFHLGQRAPIVDANTVRLYGRLFGFQTHAETRRKTWFRRLAEQLTPITAHRAYNYALLDLSRTICTRHPLCARCPLRSRCVSAQAGMYPRPHNELIPERVLQM